MVTYNQNDINRLRKINERAEQGEADAQFDIGKSYYNGHIVFKDDREALRWYRLAAEQGHAVAQLEVGSMYAMGEGVEMDKHEALIWFLVANANGEERADNGLFAVSIGLSDEFIQSAKDEAKRRFPEIENR